MSDQHPLRDSLILGLLITGIWPVYLVAVRRTKALRAPGNRLFKLACSCGIILPSVTWYSGWRMGDPYWSFLLGGILLYAAIGSCVVHWDERLAGPDA